uniref:SCP domain-containing protein n=1 Tax=Loa loa TaxID=7209 RepID=A0A1I7VQ43_LOALO
MCNIKTEFDRSVRANNDNSYKLTKCAHRHAMQHIFFSDIYANNCIVYYDFSLMKPLNLIYAWTKCCTEVNASKEQINRITKGAKAWTVGVLKCDGNMEPRCDATLVERIDRYRAHYFNYYQNKYGRLCYLKDYIEQRVTQNRSLETTWCYEKTYGRGLDFINVRDFMLENKKLPPGKICSHRLKTPIRYSNDTMFAYCFMIKQDDGEVSTVCCCSSIVDKPCNFISEKYHIEKTNVYYTKKNLQTREHCLSLDGKRDLCLLASGHKVVCYYIADMKNGKVEGGCALSLTRKTERHRLANV